jgi:prolipoprotein diacylglyceryl transferase
MSILPKWTWPVDPVFFSIPRPLVIGATVLIAGYSIYQDVRKNRSSALWTLLVFAGLSFLAWKFTEAKLGLPYFFGLIGALIAEGIRRKASDNYITAALFAALGFLALRYLPESLELRYYSLLFVGVFLGGYSFLKWQIVRGGGPAEDAGDFIVYGVAGVLVGARLGHVLFYDLDKALADPKWIFMIWTGGLASHGAVIGLIIAMWLFTKARSIPFVEGSDRFAFSAALGATLVRLGNLMNSEIVGRRVPDDAWGFRFTRVEGAAAPYRYPTQIAEILLGLFVLGVLFLVDKRLGKEKRPRGAMISTFFLVYFIGRFIIEFWKEYEPPIPAGTPYPSSLTTGQLLSLPGIAIGILGLYWSFKYRVPAGWPSVRPVEDKEMREERRRKAKAKPKDEDEDEEDDDERDRDEGGDDDERDRDEGGDDDERGSKKRDRDEPGDDDGHDDDEHDDDEHDDEHDDERDDDEDEEKPPAQHDPDIDDEFDEKGALKRRRGPSES